MIINLRLCFFFWQGIVKTSGQRCQVNSNVKLCIFGGGFMFIRWKAKNVGEEKMWRQ